MRSIKTKGTIFIVFILSIFLMFSFVIIHSFVKNWTINKLESYMQDVSKTAEAQVEEYIDLYVKPIVKLSQEEAIKSMNWSVQKEIIYQEKTLEYLALAIVDKQGIARYTDDGVVDLSDRGYIQNALAGEFNISEEIISRVTNEPVMMIAQPITTNNQVVGAIIARIQPEFLNDFIAPKTNQSFDVFFALDQAGNVIIHSEKQLQSKPINFLSFDETNYKFDGLTKAIENSYTHEEGFITYSQDNRKLFVSYSTINRLDLKFYIGFYEDTVLGDINEIDRLFVALFASLIIVAVIISWYIARFFTAPVIDLSNLFIQASNGNLSVRSSYDKDDELGEASRSFNTMMDQIRHLTYYDPITELANQQVLYRDLKAVVRDMNICEYIMVVELSSFSRVNELYGSRVGDLVLKRVAERIFNLISLNVKLYRGKGDQFILLAGIEDSQALAKKIIDCIKEPVKIDENTIIVDARVGISEYPKHGVDVDELIKKAVFASNYVKDQVKSSKIQVFNSSLYHNDLEIKTMVNKISDALDHDTMHLVYQPIYRLETMAITTVEVLIRWNDIDLGMISPGEFIPIAERNGLIQTLDHWVIKTAIQQMKQWKTQGKARVICSINITAETFENDAFEKTLLMETSKAGIQPKYIQIELTERTILKDIDGAIEKFKRLRKQGFKIAIDDFGIGYSSLNYLVRLPIDNLKIDQSFVMNIGDGKESKIIVSTLIEMAEKLGVGAIAEGIETQEELDYLLDSKCTKGQGYYLGVPMEAKKLSKLLSKYK